MRLCSGFSSFHYIKLFPIDFVKIEGEFIKNMIGDRKDLAFVKTMSILAREFGIQTVAECVEAGKIPATIREIGINYAQGHHTGRPSPALTGNSGDPGPAVSRAFKVDGLPGL